MFALMRWSDSVATLSAPTPAQWRIERERIAH